MIPYLFVTVGHDKSETKRDNPLTIAEFYKTGCV